LFFISNVDALEQTILPAARAWAAEGGRFHVAVVGLAPGSSPPPSTSFGLWHGLSVAAAAAPLPEYNVVFPGAASQIAGSVHLVVDLGHGPEVAQAHTLDEAFDKLAPGGIIVFDSLARSYANNGAYPFVSYNERFNPSAFHSISFATSWPGPKGWLDEVVLLMHARDTPSPGISDQRGLGIARASRSVDCFFNLCLLRKAALNKAVDVPMTIAETNSFVAGGTWGEIAFRSGTDKVRQHAYQWLYDRYIPRFIERAKRTGVPVRVFEIGLGCDMHYAPGPSGRTWLELFSQVGIELTFLEYDKACLERWLELPEIKSRGVKGYAGDQRDEALLARIGQERGPFDIAVDDGGHTMAMQVHTMRTMAQFVRPGGVFVLEDMHTSIMPDQHYVNDGPPFTAGYSMDVTDLVVGGHELASSPRFSVVAPLAEKQSSKSFSADQVALGALFSHVDAYYESAAYIRKGSLD